MEHTPKADLSLLADRSSSRADLGILLQSHSDRAGKKKSPASEPKTVVDQGKVPPKSQDGVLASHARSLNCRITSTRRARQSSRKHQLTPAGRSSKLSSPPPIVPVAQLANPAFMLLTKSSEGTKATTIPLIVQQPKNLQPFPVRSGMPDMLSGSLSPELAAQFVPVRQRNKGSCRRCTTLSIMVKSRCTARKPCIVCSTQGRRCEEPKCDRCLSGHLECDNKTPCEHCAGARRPCKYAERTAPSAQQEQSDAQKSLMREQMAKRMQEIKDVVPTIVDATSQPEPADAMYMHYTISQDYSGKDEALIGQKLAALGSRERERERIFASESKEPASFQSQAATLSPDQIKAINIRAGQNARATMPDVVWQFVEEMSPQSRINLEQQGVDPVSYYFRMNALAELRQEGTI